MNRNLFLFLKLIILLAIFTWIFKSVSINESLAVLKKTNLFYFFLAYLLNNLSNILITVKWYRLAAPLKIKSNFWELLKLNYISIFYSIFVPGQASGELIKGFKLLKREDSHQKVWIPIFIDKITNLLAIFLIGFTALLSDNYFRQNKLLILTISSITISLILLTIVLFSEHTSRFVTYLKNNIIKILKLIKIKTNFLKDLSLSYLEEYKKHDLLMLETFLWSFLIKFPHIFAFYFIALSLNINLNLIQSAWLFSIVSVASLLPISFSGLGIREGAVIVLLSQIGIPKPIALSLSMLIFITGVILGLTGGLLELVSLKPSKGKS